MEEDCFFRAESLHNDFHKVTRADQARGGMADRAAALEPFRIQPAVYQGEVLAAVVVLAVIDAGGLLAPADEDRLGRR